MVLLSSFEIELAGLGVAFYSPSIVNALVDGGDYFDDWASPRQVAERAATGEFGCFCTGSSGFYQLNVLSGVPAGPSDARVDLAILVTDGELHFRDIYDFLDWREATPPRQVVEVPNGFYRVTVLSGLPHSGEVGDNQLIRLHLESVPELPELVLEGVPDLIVG